MNKAKHFSTKLNNDYLEILNLADNIKLISVETNLNKLTFQF